MQANVAFGWWQTKIKCRIEYVNKNGKSINNGLSDVKRQGVNAGTYVGLTRRVEIRATRRFGKTLTF